VIVLASVVVIVAAALGYVAWRMQEPPENAPDGLRRDPARPLVVCAGASVTHGRISVSYVSLLEARLGERFQFANAGRNGDLAFNLLQRLDAVVALRPEFVLLQIGTNDVNASFSAQVARRFQRLKKLPVLPSRDFYRESLTAIVRQLRQRTDARVALLSLPLFGEDLESIFNERARSYNEIVRDVTSSEGVRYLPLHESMAAIIRSEPQSRTAPPSNRQVALAQVHRFLLGRSLDEIGARHGYRLLSDGVHLNTRGATVVADLIGEYLKGASGSETAPAGDRAVVQVIRR
jgi:lysophospholipase L1-like esterase